MSETFESLQSAYPVEILTDLFNFYNDLAPEVFNLDFKNVEFLKQVKSVKFFTYSEKEESHIPKPDIKFADEVTRCAYLLKNSVINSYCVSEHFQNVQDCDSAFFNQLKGMNAARICCFGGGSGTELFAICNVISNFLRSNSAQEHQNAIKLCFTIIDVCSEWENWIFLLGKKLKNYHKDVIDVQMRFIQANLTKKWGEDVLKAVRKADILTMVKFISTLNLNEVDYERKKDLKMLANVAHEMKLNSWIFFLDFAGGGHYNKMLNTMKKYQYFEQRQSFLHQSYCVKKSDLNISKPSLSSMYHIMLGSIITKVSSSTWQKCIPKLKIKHKKPNSVKKIPTAPKLPSASSILEEQMDGLLLKEVLKVKEEDLDDYYETPAGQEDPNKVREIEGKNQSKVKEILKKSGIYKVKIKEHGKVRKAVKIV